MSWIGTYMLTKKKNIGTYIYITLYCNKISCLLLILQAFINYLLFVPCQSEPDCLEAVDRSINLINREGNGRLEGFYTR